MVDWSRVFTREVAPTLAAHASTPPAPVVVLAVILAGVGFGLLGVLAFPRNLIGLAPLLAVGFGAVAVTQNRAAARHGTPVVREGVVVSKRIETIYTDNLSSSATEGRRVHVIDLDLSRQGDLAADGASLAEASGVARLTTSRTIFDGLSEGMPVAGVSLPIAPAHLHLRVLPDGSVVR